MSPASLDTVDPCAKEIFIVHTVFLTLDVIFLTLRFWSAHLARRKLYLDDYAILFAFSMTCIIAGAAYWAIFNGLGKHILELTPAQRLIQVKFLLISEFTYLTAVISTKISMLFLYRRIYTTPIFKRVCTCVIVLGVLFVDDVVALIPVFLTNCVPLSKYWDPNVAGSCRDAAISDSSTVAANLLLDIFVLTMPWPVLWRLQMSIRDKLTITAMFSIGLVNVALVIWRQVLTTTTRGSADWTASFCKVGIIGSLEIHLGILAVCIPTYGPLFNTYIKPIMVRTGLITSTNKSAGTRGKRSLLNTFGSSGMKKGTRGYTEYMDSIDQTISQDDNSINLGPRREGKVVAECSSNETGTPDSHQGGIRVQRDIEATYYAR
ncbi:hypothetical protein F4803DRAFT_363012 [Xylaria telfairii]|nr:hypothetical protein F4803DRAFT_363012 [Xylaria telfairii]